MRILIVSQYFYPEQFQINEVARALVDRGHSVTVLTGLPNYPGGEVYEGYARAYEQVGDYYGVRVIRCKMHPRRKGIVNLIRNYLSFSTSATRRVRTLKESFDVVYAYQLSPVLSVRPAIAFARKHGLPLFLYCLDLWPESVQAQLKNTSLPPYKIVARISRRIYAACDHISVTSRPFIDYLCEVNGVERKKMSYIPQHADASYLETDFHGEPSERVNFTYAGNMGKAQVLDVIVNAVALLKERNDFCVHFVGDGSSRDSLEMLVKELGVEDKVVFHGNQQRKDMPKYYRAADVLLLTLRGNNAVGNTMPGKLQTYMAVGKPILAAINGAAAEVIKESACGVCVPAGDSEGLAREMQRYLDDRDAYAACGARGRAYFAEHFTLDTHIENIEKRLEFTVNEYKRREI